MQLNKSKRNSQLKFRLAQVKVNRALIKYIISYMIIVVFIITVLTAIAYKGILVQLAKEVEKNNLHKLYMVQTHVDNEIITLGQLSYNIFNDSDLSSYYIRTKDSHVYNGQNKLLDYKVSNSIINDIIIDYWDDDRVYATSGIYDKDEFYNETYDFDGEKLDNYVQKMDKLWHIVPRTEVRVSGKETGNLIFFVIPRYNKTIIFVVNEDSLLQDAKSLLGDRYGTIGIYDGEGKEVLLYKQEGEEKDAVYTTFSVKSEDTLWEYRMILSNVDYMGVVNKSENIIRFTVWVLFCIGAIFACIFSFYAYKPINKIINLIGKQNGEEDNKDEFQYIYDTVQHTMVENEDMKNALLRQETFVIKQILRTILLSGEVNQANNAIIDKINVYEYYMVIALFVDRQNKEITDKVMSLFREKEVFNILKMYGGTFNIIVSSNDFDTKEKITQITINKIKNLLRSYDTYYAIGIGTFAKGIESLPKSFEEAHRALKYDIFNNEIGSVVHISQIKENNITLNWYPLEEEKQLVSYLRNGQSKYTRQVIKDIIKKLNQSDICLKMVHNICYDIMNTILKIIYEMQLQQKNEEILEYLNNLLVFNSLEEFEDKAINICDVICGYSRPINQNNETEAIIEFIHKNYNNSELTLMDIAEKFSISQSHLTNIFKKYHNTTVMKYLDQYRLKKAESLIVHTNKKLDKIVEEVGYVDKVNFVRKFRGKYGIPPITYRKLNTMKNGQ